MLDGASVVTAFRECGLTHVVWIPDSTLGQWEPALLEAKDLRLIRVCREGEAFAVAAGLHLGGKRPVIIIQCTGFFEAGDSLRNVIHDLDLPLFLVVGVRSYYAHRQGKSKDSCPQFAEAITTAWQIPYVVFEHEQGTEALVDAYRQAQSSKTASAVLLAE